MRKYMIILLAAVSLSACTNDRPFVDYNESDYNINFIETAHSRNIDSLYLKFNIINQKTNEKEFLDEIKPANIDTVIREKNLAVEGIRVLEQSKGNIPENILVFLLVDKSISIDDMRNVEQAVSYIVNTLPINSVYISFFDNNLTSSKKITPNNIEFFQEDFAVSRNNKTLFDAALLKFQELCGLNNNISEPELAEKIDNDNIKKYLVIISDGKVDANNQKTSDNIQKFSEEIQRLDDDKANNRRVEIHAIRYGEKNDDVDFTLSYLCVDIRNANVRGGSYFAAPELFIDNIKETDNTIPDYELVLVNPKGKIYSGDNHFSSLKITKSGKTIDRKSVV